MTAAAPIDQNAAGLAVLEEIEQRVLWLSTAGIVGITMGAKRRRSLRL